MAYKNDSYLVIANKFGTASSEARGVLFETYDRLRDITVSGPTISGSGFDTAGSFLWQMARLFSPSAFMPTMGGNTSLNIPGTSYWSPVSGGTATVNGGYSAFGIGDLGNYPGFPSGAAPVSWGLGSDSSGYYTGGASTIDGIGSLLGFGSSSDSSGYYTGGASSVGGIADVASAAAYGLGTANGYGFGGVNFVLPLAGCVAGWGGIMQAAAPYLGEYGLPAMVMGNLMQGTSSAALSAYQNITGRIQSNADTILSNKVKNIETVCKMLDTQGEVVRKMLKESIESDSKAIQNL
jgi:hypothetical protein